MPARSTAIARWPTRKAAHVVGEIGKRRALRAREALDARGYVLHRATQRRRNGRKGGVDLFPADLSKRRIAEPRRKFEERLVPAPSHVVDDCAGVDGAGFGPFDALRRHLLQNRTRGCGHFARAASCAMTSAIPTFAACILTLMK